jgi:hypothetical protein
MSEVANNHGGANDDEIANLHDVADINEVAKVSAFANGYDLWFLLARRHQIQ